MAKYNKEYYEPLEQMMAVRHQYMSKILRDPLIFWTYTDALQPSFAPKVRNILYYI